MREKGEGISRNKYWRNWQDLTMMCWDRAQILLFWLLQWLFLKLTREKPTQVLMIAINILLMRQTEIIFRVSFFFYILNIGYNFHQDVTLVYFIVNFRLKTHIVYVIASSSLNKISFPWLTMFWAVLVRFRDETRSLLREGFITVICTCDPEVRIKQCKKKNPRVCILRLCGSL